VGRKKLGLVLCLAAALLITAAGIPSAAEAPPIAQKPIAQIKKVPGQAAILRSGERRPAVVGDMLFVKDVIETGSDGGIGITFIDNTVFSAGPSSQIALDEFQFDSNDFRGARLRLRIDHVLPLYPGLSGSHRTLAARRDDERVRSL